MQKYISFSDKLDRRSPRNLGEGVYLRENFIPRDGRCVSIPGTTRAITTTLTGINTWSARYYTVETGQVSPKTFAYTQDGKLWYVDEVAKTATEIKAGLNLNAYPRSQLFKRGEQMYLYIVDGLNLYRYDGNNDNKFEKVTVTDSDGNPVKPIDVREHLDRLVLISDTFVFISKNLEPDEFSDATDSIQLIIGSGRGKNKALRKIQNTLFILNTEGKFYISGDIISAVASTFSIELAESVYNIIAGRTAVEIGNFIYYLAEDYEVWIFNGRSSERASHNDKLADFVNPYRDYLDMAVGTYEDNFYKLSFVETGNHKNLLEWWFDTFDTEMKSTFIRGRAVACYMQTDTTIELLFKLIGRSDIGTICYADRGYTFDGTAIRRRLWTKDIVLEKNYNSRIMAFYPDIEVTGDTDINIYYALDGRLDPNKISAAQNLEGEYSTVPLGLIHLQNQAQFTDRIRPQINYAKGETIAFYIDDSQASREIKIKGITVEYTRKERKKSKIIGA